MKIFWSWQSDIDGKISRHFIKECLSSAVKELNEEIDLDERIDIDHDTKGVPGTPSITETVFTKIKESNVFIADVTPISKITTKDGREKKIMNPNVAIEIGYAIGAIGDNNILMVNNSSFGVRDDLPFDLKYKRGPISYSLSIGSSKENIAKEKMKLTGELKESLKLYLKNTLTENVIRSNLDLNGTAIFFDTNKPLLRIRDGFDSTKDSECFMDKPDSYVYIKIIPRTKVDYKKTELLELAYNNSNIKIFPPFVIPNQIPTSNKYGVIVYRSDEKTKKVTSLVQLFLDGVIVGLSPLSSSGSNNTIYLIPFRKGIEKLLKESLDLLNTSKKYSSNDILNIEIGFVNNDSYIVIPNPSNGSVYMDNKIGPLEKEFYCTNKVLKLNEADQITVLVKNLIISMFEDLAIKFDYDNHSWN